MRSFHDKLPNPVQKVGEPQIVKTPTALVSRILDAFPIDVWANRYYKWLVPVSKRGVFELGIYIRLMKGLADVIPNHEERKTWIIKNMIWSFCPTVACEYITRRNYLSKVWDNKRWDMLEGNVETRNFLNTKLDKNGAVMVKKNNDGKEVYVK